MDDLILENKQQVRELATALAQFDAERKAKARKTRDEIRGYIIGEHESENMPIPSGDKMRELMQRDIAADESFAPNSGLTLDNIDYDYTPEDLMTEDGMGISRQDPYVRMLIEAYRKRVEDAND